MVNFLCENYLNQLDLAKNTFDVTFWLTLFVSIWIILSARIDDIPEGTLIVCIITSFNFQILEIRAPHVSDVDIYLLVKFVITLFTVYRGILLK
jgi:hypothetical protein